MVVHYPRTVWKNSYAEHVVTGKTYNLKKKKKQIQDFGSGGGTALILIKLQHESAIALTCATFFTLCRVWGSPQKQGWAVPLPRPQDHKLTSNEASSNKKPRADPEEVHDVTPDLKKVSDEENGPRLSNFV